MMGSTSPKAIERRSPICFIQQEKMVDMPRGSLLMDLNSGLRP